MIGAANSLVDRDGAALLAPRTGVVAESGICSREHGKRCCIELVPQAVARFENSQRPPIVCASRRVVSLLEACGPERDKILSCHMMVRAVVLLGDSQRS